MRARKLLKLLLLGILALGALSGEAGPTAYAWPHRRHLPKSPKYHYKPDKNAYLFGGKYKAPKKQPLPKATYRNVITGEPVRMK